MYSKENSLIFEGYQRNLRQLLVTEKHKQGKKGKKEDKKSKKDDKKKVVKEAIDLPPTEAPASPAEENPFYNQSEEEWDKMEAGAPEVTDLSPEQLEGAKKMALELGKKLSKAQDWSEGEIANFEKEMNGVKTGHELAQRLYVWAGGEGLDTMPDEYWGDEEKDGDFKASAGAPVPPANSAGASEMPRV